MQHVILHFSKNSGDNYFILNVYEKYLSSLKPYPMIRLCTILFLVVLGPNAVWCQKQLSAFIQDARPELDGELNDSCWQQVPVVQDFSTSTPVFLQTPKNATSVQLFFAEDALYVGAFCASPKVRADGSARDEVGTGDWFSIAFDTWNDDQNAFLFRITPGGLQSDARIGGNQLEFDYDAVWQSAVHLQANGWSLEMRIPYTALRFPSKGAQHWGLQMSRFDRNTGELSTWNPQNPLIYDAVLQFGDIIDLGEIRQGKRLGLYTYLDVLSQIPQPSYSSYLDYTQSNTVGLDGRWGINSNSTLDFTILPSSTYEITYGDHSKFLGQNDPLPQPRQFLAEEGPLFAKSNIFWKKQQLDLDAFRTQVYDPNCPNCQIVRVEDPRLLQATKFSTRTKNRIGIGAYNALFSPAKADRLSEDRSQTLQKLEKRANYTHLNAEMALRNNGWINVSNATLLGGPGVNSNVSSTNFRLRDKSNQYEISGNGQLLFWEYQKDSVGWDYHYGLSVAKTNGAWTWRVTHNSPTMFNKNTSPLLSGMETDIGLPNNRQQHTDAQVQYRVFQPGKWWLNYTVFAGFSKDWGVSHTYSAGASILTKQFYQWTLSGNFNPYRTLYTYFRPGSSLQRIVSQTVGADLSLTTDTRNPFVLRLALNEFFNVKRESFRHSIILNPSWVLNRTWTLRLSSQFQYSTGSLKLINGPDNLAYYFAGNDLRSFSTQFEIHWYCFKKMRLYYNIGINKIDRINYEALKLLPDGRFMRIDFQVETDQGFSNINTGLGLQYLFAPGSQLRFSFNFTSRQLYNPFLSYADYDENMKVGLTIISFLDPVKKRTFAQHE